MKLCLNSNTYHGFTFNDMLSGIKNSNISYVELSAVRGYTEHVHNQMSDKEIDDIKNALADIGCQCISISAHSNLMEQSQRDDFICSIDLAKRLGAKYIVGDAYSGKEKLDDDKMVVDTIKNISQICEAKDITFVIETHGNNYPTGKSICSLLSKIDSKYVGLNYDTANVIFYGNIMPYDDLKDSLCCVKYIHLKDKLGENQEWNFPAIGDGYIEFDKIINIVHDKKDMPLSVEIEYTSKGPKDLQEVHDSVKKSFDYLRKITT